LKILGAYRPFDGTGRWGYLALIYVMNCKTCYAVFTGVNFGIDLLDEANKNRFRDDK
jgi:hypothetical protein